MRILTASLIALGVLSLSCSGFAPAIRTQAADLVASEHAQPVPTGPSARMLAPESLAHIAARAGADRVRDDILAELDRRHTGLSSDELHLLADTIVGEATRHELDPNIVLAVIKVESGGYHLAVSPVGALGLMQLLPSTAEELARKHGHNWRGANSLFDPILNVKLGTAYLKQLESKYGSITTALAAYNWGPGRIDRKLRRGDEVPRLYREKVMKFYEAGSRASTSSSRS